MFLTIPRLFPFSKAQPTEVTNSITPKSHHCDPQTPRAWESQNLGQKAAGEEESGPDPRPAPPLKEEKIPVSLSFCKCAESHRGGRQRYWDPEVSVAGCQVFP